MYLIFTIFCALKFHKFFTPFFLEYLNLKLCKTCFMARFNFVTILWYVRFLLKFAKPQYVYIFGRLSIDFFWGNDDTLWGKPVDVASFLCFSQFSSFSQIFGSNLDVTCIEFMDQAFRIECCSTFLLKMEKDDLLDRCIFWWVIITCKTMNKTQYSTLIFLTCCYRGRIQIQNLGKAQALGALPVVAALE